MSPGAWQETGSSANRKRGEEEGKQGGRGERTAWRGRVAIATEEMSNGCIDVEGTREEEEW